MMNHIHRNIYILLIVLLIHMNAHSDVFVMLSRGKYNEAQSVITKNTTHTIEDYAILSFIELILSESPEAYQLSLKADSHYLGMYVRFRSYISGIGIKPDSKKSLDLANQILSMLLSNKELSGFEHYIIANVAEYLKLDIVYKEHIDIACERNVAAALNMKGLHCKEVGDINSAIIYFERAASLGLSEAMNILSDIYKRGIGINKDLAKAIEYCIMAAKDGDVKSMIDLADLYMQKGMEIDAQQWIIESAKKGHYLGCLALGNAYITGRYGFTTNQSMGFNLIKKAAQSGRPIALNHLAKLYLEGTVTEKNTEKAVLLYKCAYVNGDKEAAKSLILLYYISNNKDLQTYWMTKIYSRYEDLLIDAEQNIKFKLLDEDLMNLDPFAVKF